MTSKYQAILSHGTNCVTVLRFSPIQVFLCDLAGLDHGYMSFTSFLEAYEAY